MVEHSGLSARTFTRRFKAVTGYTPIDYVQALRIEEAKQALERDQRPIDEIGVTVGYEDASSTGCLETSWAHRHHRATS